MLTDELKAEIQGAYSAFLEARGFRPRQCQRQMVAEVARTLSTDAEETAHRFCVIEAGTGTGKTVAYSLAAIPVARARDKTLVISTATVALQEQIVLRDLPDIRRMSGLDFNWTLAKGRRRYLCLAKLDQALENAAGVNQRLAFYEDEMYDDDEANVALYQRFLGDFGSGEWDGERDSWPDAVEDRTWSRVSTDHVQCTGRKCAFFDNCVFYRAREQVHKVDVIVANHDLVLSDLLMGGGNVLPDPEACIFVFDEGHHLPDKAVNHLSSFIALNSSSSWLREMPQLVEQLVEDTGPVGRFREGAGDLGTQAEQLAQGLLDLAMLLQDYSEGAEAGERSLQYRFPQGVVPGEVRSLAAELASMTNRLLQMVDGLHTALEGVAEDTEPGENDALERWLPVAASMVARLEGQLSLWEVFSRPDNPEIAPVARWLDFLDEDTHLRASPIAVNDVLQEQLWERADAGAVTSATIAMGGDFSRFQQQSGLRDASFTCLPSPFRFQEQAVLSIPPFAGDPRERDDHTAMMIERLPDILSEELGSLVLFTSWYQLFDVHDGIDETFRERVLRQGELARSEIVRLHRERVDRGEQSVIFGVASFAEGIDLPGRYCDHVVISKIPFAVPDDPVGATLSEWIEGRGGNAFQQIMVPDAALRLVQSCGRLLRTEEDTGRITILDERLLTQRYGRTLISALPPFRLETGRR